VSGLVAGLPELGVRGAGPDECGRVDFHGGKVGVGDGVAVCDGEGLAGDVCNGPPGVDDGPSVGLFETAQGFCAVFGDATEGVLEGGAGAVVGLIW
jgi:hypothetical protein